MNISKKEIKQIAQRLRGASLRSRYKTDLRLTIQNIEKEYGYTIESNHIDVNDINELLSFSGKSGSIRRNTDTSFSITLNPYDSKLRQRFTIAHELGHIVLEHLQVGLLIVEPTINILDRSETWDPNDYREREANSFAAELLMPEELMKTFFPTNERIDMQFIEAGAKQFNVSKSAMITRLSFLNFYF